MPLSTLNDCPAPPPMLKPDTISKTASMSANAGMKGCKTSAKSTNAKANVEAIFGLTEINAEVTTNDVETYGCEQVVLAATTYNTAISNIACIIKKSAVTVDNVASGINSINLHVGGDLKSSAGSSINFRQAAKVSLVNVTKIGQMQKNEIVSQVKAVTDDIRNSIQSSTTQTGATAQGGKTMTEIDTIYQKADFNKSVNDTLTSFSTSAHGSNTLDINIKGNFILTGPLNATQDLVVELLSKSILDDAIYNTFQDISEITNKNIADSKQTSENSGFADIYDSLASPEESPITKIIKMIIGISVLLIILFVGYKIYQKKKSMTGF